MALKGAQILIYPTAIGWFDADPEDEKTRQRDAWITVQRGHAVANGLPLVAVNRLGFEKDESGVLEGIRFWGSSFACGPQGEMLAQASSTEEEVVLVDIDLKRSEEVRRWWPFLRDRRIDAYEGLLKRYID
jgi:N-carbamoylputrescine amidase